MSGNLQRALLQWKRPEMRRLVVEALHRAGREDLIGYGKDCLIRPLHSSREKPQGKPLQKKGPVKKKARAAGPAKRRK